MGANVNIPLFILQVILILILIVILVQILIFRHATNLERKIGRYSIAPINNNSISFFDKLETLYKKTIKFFSKIFNHSVVLKNSVKKYDKYIEYSKKGEVDPMDYFSIKIITMIVMFLIVVIFNVLQYKNFTISQFLLIFIIGFFTVDIILFIKEKRRQKRIDEDMLKAIIIMNSAFKSGRTTMQAIEIVKNELSGPIGEEFRKMYIDISFGLELDVVFERFSKRIDSDDARYISASLTILNKTGGDIVKVFSSIEKSFFNRKKLQHELKTLTSSSEIMFKVLVAAPFIIFLVMYFLNPEYFTPLFTTTIGMIIIFLIIVIFVLYVYFVKRIMRIKV